MKTFGLSLSLLVFPTVFFTTQAHSEEGWWFQSAKKSVQKERPEIESVPPQPTLLTESEASLETTTPTPKMQPHAIPSDPRQLPHEPCPPCGMG